MTRTAELTSKLLDGTLSAAESVELDALIGTDPGAGAEHLALLELEAELRGLLTEFDLAEPTLARVEAAQAERTAGAVLSAIATRPAPVWAPLRSEPAPEPRHRSAWVSAGAMVACAAALLVALWIGAKYIQPVPNSPTAPEPTAFAKLARKSGSVEVLTPTGDVISIDEGAELPAGFTVRTGSDDSHAVVELLHEKARVEIESDSIVRFAGDTPDAVGKPRLFLAAGQLTAAVTPRPDDRPLVVGTPVAEVFARGATFVVASAGPDSARVDIKDGKVELVRAAAPKPVPVTVGGAAMQQTGFDRMDIIRSGAAERTPKYVLAAPGARDAVFSPDGSEVWVASARALGRWSPSGALVETGFRRGPEGVAAFSRDRRFLLTFRGEKDDRVLIRTVPDGGELASVNARPADPRFWALAPDGSWLAVVDPRPNNKRVRVRDVATDEERFLREFDDQITALAASPDAKQLAVAVHTTVRGVSNKIVVLDAHSSDRLFSLSVLKKPATAMAFSPDGGTLAVAYNGAVQLWDVRGLELVRTITGFERPLTCLCFAPDGKRLAGGTPDGHVWVWNTESGRQTQLIEVGGRGVRSVCFSPDGKQLVTAAAQVAVWDVTDPIAASEIQ